LQKQVSETLARTHAVEFPLPKSHADILAWYGLGFEFKIRVFIYRHITDGNDKFIHLSLILALISSLVDASEVVANDGALLYLQDVGSIMLSQTMLLVKEVYQTFIMIM
jgi:hypothetical protein